MGRYTTERLAALRDRVERLEHAVEAAGAILETGVRHEDLALVDAKAALLVLQQAIVEDFYAALLCSRETTDEHLEKWLPLAPRRDPA